jgi:hypothetical protein
MKNAIFWDVNTQFVPHRKHYVSATKPRRLMLCRFDIFTAVTMKNAVFWDIETCSYLTGNTLPLHYKAQSVNATSDVRFFTTVTMKNAVFWDVTPRGSCKTDVSENLGSYKSHTA